MLCIFEGTLEGKEDRWKGGRGEGIVERHGKEIMESRICVGTRNESVPRTLEKAAVRGQGAMSEAGLRISTPLKDHSMMYSIAKDVFSLHNSISQRAYP
jgi:hypothetical protein